jgi:hypothetical protein
MTSRTHRRSGTLAAICAAVLVAPASFAASSAAPSLRITPTVIDFGTTGVVLSGVIPSKRAGEKVSILSQPCLFTEAAEIATTTTKAGGAFRFRVQPMLNTRFRVRWNQSLSSFAKVDVRPLVDLERVAAGRYRVEVTTTNPVFLNGKSVELQRAVGARWVTVKRAKLVKASPETAITVISAANITVRTTGRLRARLPTTQARCYLGAASTSIGA